MSTEVYEITIYDDAIARVIRTTNPHRRMRLEQRRADAEAHRAASRAASATTYTEPWELTAERRRTKK